MADAAVLDMRDMVVSNHSFGPSEIRQICNTISEDYSQLGILRDAVTELGHSSRTAAQRSGSFGCQPILIGQIFRGLTKR
jgi:DNA-directed RNA polymerase subunit alpha